MLLSWGVIFMVTYSGLSYSASAQPNVRSVATQQIYPLFFDYRTALNQRKSIEVLANHFSSEFNQYYQSRLKTKNSERNNLYLNQYWNNLQWGKEILVVTDYGVNRKSADRIQLLLVYISDSLEVSPVETNRLQANRFQTNGLHPGHLQKMTFKQAVVDYLFEAGDWKINAFEFNLNHSQERAFDPEKTIDNFVELK